MLFRIALVSGFLVVVCCAAMGSAGKAFFDAGSAIVFRSDSFQSWTLEELGERQAESGRAYHPFLNVSSMHCGIYALAAGAEDKQQPHDEDEIYVVDSGSAKFTAGDKTVDIGPGSILFVPARMPHRFHDIQEDLQLIVFFSKAEPGDDSEKN